MYRPTIRMNDLFKEWGDEWEGATTLKMAQLFRLALVIGAESKTFRDVASQYLKEGITALPSPKWEGVQQWLWKGIDDKIEERGEANHGDVSTALVNGYSGGTFGERIGVLQATSNRRMGGSDREATRTTIRKIPVKTSEARAGIIHLGDVNRLGGVIRVNFDTI